MPITSSLSSYFVGPMGALIMSFISMSIVFLVIIGLMLVMKATGKLAASFDKKTIEGK
ncbi:OadG family protein [Cloacibacillus porcorum]|jgi:Na+-transporting methylmalonyl-CoA/oxaloacetate decarboxylase gamma subunit|uniref:OadG family protein n=1 Tax=uncultured Cloacibacillus sp. TaxID=889794 RepID=UPI0027D93EF9|nr:OadG family protein [uncultured Cloacibacillus sp.]MCD8234559.1 OadG family protein [Cloacibacillus porcorum]MCD8392354.1 OadG family protein [Cloacibacillus porcorum]